jgi:hypothetical protein
VALAVGRGVWGDEVDAETAALQDAAAIILKSWPRGQSSHAG